MQEKSCTIGKFESFHKGHQKLIQEVKKFKNPEILSILFPESGDNPSLFTLEERKTIATRFKIKLSLVPFNKIKNLSAQEFFQFLKKNGYTTIVVGSDWRFGKGREGDVEKAKKLGEIYKIKVVEVKPLKHNGRKISTSWIKELLNRGDIEKANFLLGFPFFTTGNKVKGKGLGKKLGFPTINIKPAKKLLLPYGVYKVYAKANGKKLLGAANFGVRPTVDGKEELLEVHILNRNFKDLKYEKPEIEFLKFIRKEKKFNSIEELQKQIKLDVKTILLNENGGSFE
ncbi:riboflavin biosynthesis protein RibF [Desulfurobacterium atlanticum]|uniref:Riboflavin biosynthesis protein n=1 Tax=Desulfurobacterium atlanticum TaxID=240169 RepID=A0A239ABC3_9BACT|nr:riboflavin biosynthesis protein RibF [Desulfurobacterium atlanticum]SNR92641.1 riboflavin kinase / FMN adenylyltransferase [Desulfurobacterium atlanticum]